MTMTTAATAVTAAVALNSGMMTKTIASPVHHHLLLNHKPVLPRATTNLNQPINLWYI
jgi:hypothetical protein